MACQIPTLQVASLGGAPKTPKKTMNVRRKKNRKENKSICLQFQGKRKGEKDHRQSNNRKRTNDARIYDKSNNE